VLFDPGPLATEIPGEVLEALLPSLAMLSCNATEARALSGSDTSEAATRRLAARLSTGAAVVVRDGRAGCLLARDGAVRRIDGFPVEAVDTNGAGDTHNAAAALSVQRNGPATAPSRAEIQAFLNRS
jgi:sugar/nucleoside kinase (ribokinase family)